MSDFLPVPPAELWQATLEHLRLSLIALLCAVALAVPLAVWLADKRRWAEGVLQVTNILQTIPSLALLGLLIPFVGIGSPPVLIALTLYALLPIFQNTYLGLSQIDPAIREAHTAFGLSRWQALWRIDFARHRPQQHGDDVYRRAVVRPARRTGQRRHRHTAKVQAQNTNYRRPACHPYRHRFGTDFSNEPIRTKNHHRRQARQRTRHSHQYVQTVD